MAIQIGDIVRCNITLSYDGERKKIRYFCSSTKIVEQDNFLVIGLDSSKNLVVVLVDRDDLESWKIKNKHISKFSINHSLLGKRGWELRITPEYILSIRKKQPCCICKRTKLL